MSLSLKDVIGVNRKHPLNRNRVCWWLCLPRTMGGRQWLDLMGKNHGTLTNMNATSGWRSVTRPGGAGHVLFSASSDRVVTDTVQFGIGSGDFTLAAWAYAVTMGTTYSNGVIGMGSFQPAIYMAAGSGRLGLYLAGSRLSNFSPVAGQWYRLIVGRRSGNVIFGINGVLDSGTPSASGTVSDAVVTLGNDGSWSSSYTLNGSLDDVSIWNRSLSNAEILQDYNLSRAGYPGVLLREGDNA